MVLSMELGTVLAMALSLGHLTVRSMVCLMVFVTDLVMVMMMVL